LTSKAQRFIEYQRTMNLQDLKKALLEIKRYEHAVVDDGDGHVDEWARDKSDGDYVLWYEIKELADKIL
jgi:hypothetical protein